MSEKQTLTKSQRKRRKKTEKRKASGSPETEIDSHYTPNQPAANSTRIEHDIFDSSERYVQSVMSFNASPVTNFGQPFQYGFQTPASTTPPSWATQIMEDVKSLKGVIPKIDKIEASIQTLTLKMSQIETKLTTLDKKVNDMDKAVTFMDSGFESQKKELDESKEEIKRLKRNYQDMGASVKKCETQNEAVSDKVLDLESRSMRENLIFYGIHESQRIDDETGDENCERLVKDLISTKLEINTENMTIDRAHRLGGPRAKKPRPIVVKFHQYSDRETVRVKSRNEAVKMRLRESNQGIGVQQPQQYREARRALFEQAKREEERGKRTRIVGNKLYVNNRVAKKYVNGSVHDVNGGEN